jgi:hypothetical protein
MSSFHNGTGQNSANISFNEGQPVVVIHKVCFCDDHQSFLDLQQIKNGQVLARLRHDAFIGGDDKQGRIDTAHARKHVFDEVTMTGNINDANFLAARQGKPAEAEINGHLALLLLFQTVWMCARERGDQSGFAVIDMPGGTNDAHIILLRNTQHVFCVLRVPWLCIWFWLARRRGAAHDAPIIHQEFVCPVHQFLKLGFGGFAGLLYQVL